MFCFFPSQLLLVLLVLFLSCCVSCLLSLLAELFIFCCCFMPLMKASRLAFVLILPFFPIRERNATVCIRPWYFLRCRTLTGAVMKRLPAISFLSLFFFFSWGKFLTSFCRHQSLGQSLSPYLRAFLHWTWRAALMSLLCRATLINSALFLHTRETTVHVQVLNKQRRHSSLDWRSDCSEWVAKCFSHAPFTSFFFFGNNNEWIKQKNPISFMLFISWKSPRWRPFGLLL